MTEKHPLFVASVEGSLVVGSSGNVDRHLLMFLDWMILASDTCLVHAAAVEHDGVGTLISGWGGTGKTATLARLCQREGASFVADDMVFVTRSGHALALPKPMYIYPYHRPLFPYLFEADHKPLVPKALTPQVERMRRAARPLVAAYPPLENWARKHTPEHMKTAPATAMPGLRIANTVPVAQVIRLSRGLGTEPVVRSVDPDSVVEGLVHELFHELIDVTGPMAAVAATSGGVMSLRHWLTERQSVISDHLEKTRVIQIDLPVHADATYTAELVSRVVFDPPPDGRDK